VKHFHTKNCLRKMLVQLTPGAGIVDFVVVVVVAVAVVVYFVVVVVV